MIIEWNKKKELAKIDATDDGVKGDVFVRRACEKKIYK